MNGSLIFTWVLTLFLACPLVSQMGGGIEPPELVQQSSGMSEISFQGVVIDNVHDCAFDGNCYAIVETADGTQYDVIYTMGMLGCDNPNLDNDLWDFAAGTEVEVYAEVLDDGSLSVCSRGEYYINQLAK